MAKGTGTTTTTSSSAPPDFALPYTKEMLASAQKNFQSPGPQYYPGQQVAGFTPTQTQAQSSLSSAATGGAGDVAKSTAGAFDWGMKNVLDVNSNPYLQKSVQAATQPITQDLLESALPSIRASSIGGGNFGGSRQGLAEAQAVERAARAADQTASNMYSDAYERGLGTYSNLLSMAPTVQSTQFAPGQALSAVGDQQQQQAQQEINAEMSKWAYNQNLPYMKLTDYSNLIKGPFGGQGTSTVTGTSPDSASQISGTILSLLPWLTQLIP